LGCVDVIKILTILDKIPALRFNESMTCKQKKVCLITTITWTNMTSKVVKRQAVHQNQWM